MLMIRRSRRWAPIVVAGGLVLAGCATGQVTTEGAGVATGEATGGGVTTLAADSGEGGADDSATAESVVQDNDDADSGSAAGSSETEGVATGSSYEGLVAVEIIGEPAGMSTDLGEPDAEWGVLNVTDAWIPKDLDGLTAPAGMQFVVANYELYWAGSFGNFFDNALRLNVDGVPYPPTDNINETGGLGQVINSQAIFEVPADGETFEIEGGIAAGTPGGRTASFGLVFGPGEPPGLAEGEPLIPEDVDVVSIKGEPATVSVDIGDTEVGTVSITGARITSIEGDYLSHGGTKLVVIDFTLDGFQRYGNVQSPAFRMRAGGEWYSPISGLNETTDEGETLTLTMVFEVAIWADDYLFEAGIPSTFMALDAFPADVAGQSATWELVFP